MGRPTGRARLTLVRNSTSSAGLPPCLVKSLPPLPVEKWGASTPYPPLANAIAKLSDADADYCLFGLLAVVSRKQPQGTGWGPVSTGDTLMYADLDMVGMLQLAWKALEFNMSGFFAALPSDLKEAARKASDPSNG